MTDKKELMQLAMELAETGRGKTSPNPFVGCVIVKDGEIVGKGVTQHCGGDHAEVQALKQAGDAARGAEMFVTLEPCCHYGKTPPCTKAIIKAGIKKVNVGCIDPNPKVQGKGIQELLDAGIEIDMSYEAEKVKDQLEYYFRNIRSIRPFIILKTATTIDGYICAEDGSSKWITGEEARRKVHKLRGEVDAIITGIGTVLADDPQLNSRYEDSYEQPMRIILDSHLRIPMDSIVVQTAYKQKTLVVHANCDNEEKINLLLDNGVEVYNCGTGKINVYSLMSELYLGYEIAVVLVEAGQEVVSSFVRDELIDKYYFFIAPKLMGNGRKVISIPENTNIMHCTNLDFRSVHRYGDDILMIAYPVSQINNLS